jgi:hypothetical protein
LFAALIAAAALILGTWMTENPREMVSQSWLGLAPQNGHVSEIGLIGNTFSEGGGFAIWTVFHMLESVTTVDEPFLIGALGTSSQMSVGGFHARESGPIITTLVICDIPSKRK